MDNTPPLTASDIEHIIAALLEAGKAVMEIYRTGFTVDVKEDNSPVTEADRQSQQIIESALREIRDSRGEPLPFLGEEGQDIGYPVRSGWKKYWLVDPLDGTKEFVNRRDEFTLNIALISEKTPAAGFVYLPAADIMYWGVYGTGAFKSTGASSLPVPDIISSGITLPDTKTSDDKLLVVGSKSHMNDETLHYIESLKKRQKRETRLVQAGSSLKLCRIAEGSADVYPRFGPTMEWDVAAAHGVCRAAGCSVIDISTGKEMIYNKENLLNNHFIAAPRDTIEAFLPE